MKYETPKMDMILLAGDDAIMVSLEDLFAIDLWDMLLEE